MVLGSPGMSGCRCLCIIRVPYTWNPTVRRDQQFATADIEVVALEKALEAQRMEILQRDLPAHFNTGASGGPSPGDAMTLPLTALEARTDMLKCTCVGSDTAPNILRVKTPEERWGEVL